MSAVTITTVVTLQAQHCIYCAAVYGLTTQYTQRAQSEGSSMTHCCPYCKGEMSWGKGSNQIEKERLERELQRATQNVAWYEKRSRDKAAEAEHFRKSRDGMKGALAKVKKRVAHGVCPCCTRSFSNPARHMATKHPQQLKET